MNRLTGILVSLIILFASCSGAGDNPGKQTLNSPDGNIEVSFWLDDGKPYYSVNYKNQPVINPSAMGFIFEDNDGIYENLKLNNRSFDQFNETWEQPWGEQRLVTSHYNEGEFELMENDGKERKLIVTFRVFEDGVGFRYTFPEQDQLNEFIVMDELTEFVLPADHKAWWIPAYSDNRYEYLYTQSAISEIDKVHTPFTIEFDDKLVISIHEAALKNFPSMTIASLDNNVLKSDLIPWSNGTKAKVKAPLETPWRTIQIADNAGGLVTSTMILNLNEPNKLADMSFVEPHKYLGIWWGMHIGKYTFWEGPNHGATTERSKRYIDYCVELGVSHLLIEGWNTGWTPEWYENLMHVFSFTETTPDFDFEEVMRYADKHNIKIIGYHETGSNIDNYLAQIDDGMGMYRDANINDIKIGQVGSRMNLQEWHHGQFGVEYYQYVLDKAAEYKLAVNFHEPIKPTGMHRTYPHWMTSEGARGQEYNAWSEGNPPEHEAILPFTRLLGGGMDFTPGVFGIKGTRVHTTLAKQLALYLTIYSPAQMLADLPENYVGHPAFQFLKDVPVNWETTVVLNARIGDYYTVARRDIDSDDWYLGSITDENSRTFEIELSFLDEGRTYTAQIYADGENAEFGTNPEVYAISEMQVNSTTILPIHLAKGGGQAIRFVAQ